MNVGAQLRASREAKGLSIDTLAQTTRVRPRILAAIERNDVSAVPPRPFGRGFVRAYAREIGLDPEQTARDYFAQFAATPPAQPDHLPQSEGNAAAPLPRTWIWSLVVGVGLLALGLSTAINSRSVPATSEVSAAGIVGTSGAAGQGDAADATGAAAAERRGQTAAAPTATAPPKLTVVLTTSRPCWMTATADGRRVIYRLLPPGANETLTADREIAILAGDAGAVTWTINGRSAGALGSAGQIKTLRVTPETADNIK